MWLVSLLPSVIAAAMSVAWAMAGKYFLPHIWKEVLTDTDNSFPIHDKTKTWFIISLWKITLMLWPFTSWFDQIYCSIKMEIICFYLQFSWHILSSFLHYFLFFVCSWVFPVPTYYQSFHQSHSNCVIFYLCVSLPASISCALHTTCTMTGSTVIDFIGRVHFVPDRCAYNLMKSSSIPDFQVLGVFQERRRKDMSFLDHVILQLDGPGVQISLEQGGRVQVS